MGLLAIFVFLPYLYIFLLILAIWVILWIAGNIFNGIGLTCVNKRRGNKGSWMA